MNIKYVKTLLLAAVCSSGVLMGEDALQKSVNTTLDAFSVDKQKQEATANSFISQGNDLFMAGSYKDAARQYAQAAYIFDSLKENSEHFREKAGKTRELIARCYYYLAQETALKAHEESNANGLENAIALCKEAITIYPASAEEMNQRIAIYEKMRVAAQRRNRLSEDQVMPDKDERNYKISVLLKQAKILYYTGQYEQARKRYQEVLLLDKLSPEAIQGARAADLQIKKAAQNRRRITHKEAITEAAWESVLPINKHEDVKIFQDITDGTTIKKDSAGAVADGTEAIRKKLKNIVIPRVSFSGDATRSGTPLPDALNFLRLRSKLHDPEGVGVNIFLYYPQKEDEQNAAAGAAPAAGEESVAEKLAEGNNDNNNQDDFGDGDDFGDENADTTTKKEDNDSARYPQVNMDLVNKTLLEIIETLAQTTNMKYKIEKHAVVLAPRDAPLDDMQIKIFPFDDSMLQEVGGNSDQAQLIKDLEALDENIKFPSGSKVLYDPKFRSLIVLNTPENLTRIGEALVGLSNLEPPVMVQVQVKFVEIEQDDLKELGFIQSLARPYGDQGQTNGRLQFDKNDDVLGGTGKNTFTFSRTENSYNYNLVINAINQMNSKDVLSSPKVLTVPGKKASISITSERYYAWDYEEGDSSSDTSEGGIGTYSIVPLWPEFEMQTTGITFDVTPNVDKEKRLITMRLQPLVKALVGFKTYTYTDESGQEQEMSRPIFSNRKTDTTVTISDNETIVIGGMITDSTVTVENKVPFLGDIPLLGNFFKNKSKTVKKTNLLIFVTARMLQPDGSPYFASDSRGRPTSAGIGDVY